MNYRKHPHWLAKQESNFISSVALNNSEQFRSSTKSRRSETKLERCAAKFMEEDACKRRAGESARPRIHSSNLLMMKTAESANLAERKLVEEEEEEDFARQVKETASQRKEASQAPQMAHANEVS